MRPAAICLEGRFVSLDSDILAIVVRVVSFLLFVLLQLMASNWPLLLRMATAMENVGDDRSMLLDRLSLLLLLLLLSIGKREPRENEHGQSQ